MYRAIPVIHPTLEFRHQQENYMRHMTNVSTAKATIDTSHPPPVPRLEVYQRRMTRDRAMRLKIENEYIRAIKAAALERTRARAPRTANRRTKPPRDWEGELPKVNEELTGKPRPPKTAASRKREESIFEQEIYQDDGMVVIDERKAKPVLQRRVKSQRVVKPTTGKGRQVSWRRSIHEMEEEKRNEEKKAIALGEDKEDAEHSEEEKKEELSRTFGDDFDEDAQNEKKAELSRTFGDDFENDEQTDKKELSRTFGDDFEEDAPKEKMDMSRTFGDDFDEEAQNEKKMDMSRTFGDDFEESNKKSEGERDAHESDKDATSSDKDTHESDNSQSESEKQTNSDREYSHSATEFDSESEKSQGEYSADSDINDAKLDTNMMAGALMAKADADGDEDFHMIIRTDKQNDDSPDDL